MFRPKLRAFFAEPGHARDREHPGITTLQALLAVGLFDGIPAHYNATAALPGAAGYLCSGAYDTRPAQLKHSLHSLARISHTEPSL